MNTKNLSSTESQRQKLHNLLIKAIYSVINSTRLKLKSIKIYKAVNRKVQESKIKWRDMTFLILGVKSIVIKVKNLRKISLNMILVSAVDLVIFSTLMNFLSIIMVALLFLCFPRKISGPFLTWRENNLHNTEQNLLHNTSIDFSIIKN